MSEPNTMDQPKAGFNLSRWALDHLPGEHALSSSFGAQAAVSLHMVVRHHPGVPVVLMHHQGAPETMQQDPRYGDVLIEVYEWLEERIAAAEAAGIARANILVDPGFGFGKTVAHNLELMNGLALFHSLGCPVVLGASRKRTIGALSNEAPADQRLAGSIALALKAAEQGVQIVRVHDVPDTVQALKVWRGLRDQALTPRT